MQRSDFRSKVKRIVVKVGTSVVTQPDGSFALGRLGYVVEQISQLQLAGKDVVLVSSGAVGKGAQELARQRLLTKPLADLLHSNGTSEKQIDLPARACAAAGQSGLMSLYDDMFKQKGMAISQILLTENDFRDIQIKRHLKDTMDTLLKWNVIPIINENDVISTRTTPIRDEGGAIFWDNDSLAALIATEVKADLLILLSDVEGIFTCHPDDPQAKIISTYKPGVEIVFGAKSRIGRGGMQAKIDAAINAVDLGIPAVVIASGYKRHSITEIMEGKRIGTLFTKANESDIDDPKKLAIEASNASLALRTLKGEERSQILVEYAQNLEKNIPAILVENEEDYKAASRAGIDKNSLARLKLSESKLNALVTGIKQIAHTADPLGTVLSRTELAPNLVLEKISAPIGVLLVIFEARPDALPQLSALAIRSGNGLLLKGGKEAQRSNKILHKLIQDAIVKVTEHTSVRVPGAVIGLVETREHIEELLKLDRDIDLVIPRGSSTLVRYIQENTKIPVLGHSEGICHVYVHSDADISKATRIVIDAKMDYPAACNAAETLLVHVDLMKSIEGSKLLESLVASKIELFGCPHTISLLENSKIPIKKLAKSFHHEYGDAKLTVVTVEDVNQAIHHVNTYGSGHTEAIICEDPQVAKMFLEQVNSACVFHNASTRFADGYRFGLGAEVGISTSRIHARGPVGVDGLLSMKWVLRSTSTDGHIVGEFTKGTKKFTHIPLPSKL